MLLLVVTIILPAAAGSINYHLACRRHSGTFVFIVSVAWPLAALTALFWRGGVGAGLNACWPKLQSFCFPPSIPSKSKFCSIVVLTFKTKRIKVLCINFES